MKPLRIGTRGSALALWQAHHIAGLLSPYTSTEIVELRTVGDAVQDRSLATLSLQKGFGVFTREIQAALLDNRVDVAVHSLKDLPTLPVDGVEFVATPERGPTGDCWVSLKYPHWEDLPKGATVGTSSLRRRAQLKYQRPDLNLVDLRGNVDTRLKKLETQDLAGIVLAEAGLRRLGLSERITQVLDTKVCLPAVGQGAIGLECRTQDSHTRGLLQNINHEPTWFAVRAERSMLNALGGGCLVPIAVGTQIDGAKLHMRAVVLDAEGTRRVLAHGEGPASEPLALGASLAADLMIAGARELLETTPAGQG